MRSLTALRFACFFLLPLAAIAAEDWRAKVDALFTFQATIASSPTRNSPAERVELEYWRRVKELGSSLDEAAQARIAAAPVDAASIMALAAIDYAHDPQKVDELLGWYGSSRAHVPLELRQKTLASMKNLGYPENTWVPQSFPNDPWAHVPPPPYEPFPIHLRPEYRTGWEIILFAPERLSFGQCPMALAKIHDPRSLTLLRERFHLMANECQARGWDETRSRRCTDLLAAFFEFGGAPGLESLFECVEFAEAHGAVKTEYASIRFCALALFSRANSTSISPSNDPLLEKWKEYKSLFEAMLAKPDLSPTRRAFLERALDVLPI